jgi:hypothetical protein
VLVKSKVHDKFVKEIAKELKMDKRVVNFVASHPFLFISNLFRNSDDYRPVRCRYLGTFAIKKNANKK